MSYSSRVYRQRNAHVYDNDADKQPAAFFNKSGDRATAKNNKPAFFQAKLAIGQPNDAYEKEADAVANAVVNQQQGTAPVIQQKNISSIQRYATPVDEEQFSTNDARMKHDKDIQEKPEIQRKCAHCEQGEKESSLAVQTKPAGGANTVSPNLSSSIANSAGKGNTLPKKTLTQMNHSFGADFSNVKIHTGSESVHMNKELHAQAFTHGTDIYFNSGRYNTETAGGKELLAHELTHVVQQNEGISKKKLSEEDKLTNLSSQKYKDDERLQQAFDNSPLLKLGECNESVRRLQEGLVADGFAMPKSTKENGEMDGDFGTETMNTIMNFQSKKEIDRDGVVGRDTLTQLDNLANAANLPVVQHTTPVTCHPKPKIPKQQPAPVTGCNMHAIYANQRNFSFCKPSSCGIAVQFDIARITKTGTTCLSDFEGKTLNERVTIDPAETTCPTKGNIVAGSCSINKDGTTNGTDSYGICFPKKIASDLLGFSINKCQATMVQELIIDGQVFETRKILFSVFFDFDFNAPGFVSCNGNVTIS